MNPIRRLRIFGRVQGVWYRGWTVEAARQLGLDGWVRNRRDGSVEALFCGPPGVVSEMVALCRHGPPGARVDNVISETASEDALNLRRAGERFSVLGTV